VQISKRCEYGLRAMIDLGVAERRGRSHVGVPELARHERISPKYLEQILTRLRTAGYLDARRGRAGGYGLARPPRTIVMGDLVRLLEGPLAPIRCVSETAYERCSCPDEAHCGLRLLMGDVRAAVSRVLDRHTLADAVTVTLRSLRRDGEPIPFAPQEAS